MIKLIMAAAVSVSLISISACGSAESGDTAPADSVEAMEAAVELPGTLLSPTGDTVETETGKSYLVYYWLPLELYDEMQDDLLYLVSMDSSIVPLPVQPDPDSRNHAQRVVNDLGISLTVYLADSQFMSALDCSILPSAVLFSPGKDPTSDWGFGSPSRLSDPDLPGE